MVQAKRTRRTQVLLLGSFGAILALVVATQVVTFSKSRTVKHQVDLIQRNALASIRLIGRMGMAFEHQRVLLARHIFERDEVPMDSVEAQLADAQRDFAAAEREYAPLVSFEGEVTLWNQLQEDVTAADRYTSAALALSRKNLDADAHHVLDMARPAFDAVNRDLEAAVEINRSAGARTQDEIDDLQTSSLELRMLLSAAIAALTIVIGIYVTRAIRRRERKLEIQATELENRNRELDAFAGRVAHDLRGPLSTIQMSASLVAERFPAARSTTTILSRGLAQMNQLVTDLLELSRIRTMPLNCVARTEPVAAAFESDVRALVDDAGGALHVDLEPAAVSCTEGLLLRALWNLAENAVKYRRPDVPLAIDVVGRKTDAGYEIRLTDNGVGMSPEDAQHVFEPFYRAASTSMLPGTGLGLAIVRRVAEASGGSVSVESKPERGTTFALALPLTEA